MFHKVLYSYIYNNSIRLNSVKEELLKESYFGKILYHGSKFGLNEIKIETSRNNCDFGKGFYLGEMYDSAIAFIADIPDSSVYSFKFNDKNDLKIKYFDTTLEWMLSICTYRGIINQYLDLPLIKKIKSEVDNADVIVAPIADNRMFNLMSEFADSIINADVALHTLSASNLGYQYVFKTEKALSFLHCEERYYISKPEREERLSLKGVRYANMTAKYKMALKEYSVIPNRFIEDILQ